MAEGPASAVDLLLGGRLSLRQMRSGHRAGTDAVLLAAAVPLSEGDRFVDVGAGVGTAGLVLAQRCAGITGILLEADAATAALARENCRLNALQDRVEVVEADLFAKPSSRSAALAPEGATLVMTNPPFHGPGDVRVSPDARKAAAHVLGSGGHADWVRAALALLAPKGRFVMIHRPDALPVLLEACAGRLGALVVRPVQARSGADAVRVLIRGIKGSRAPLRIATAFVLHGPDGGFTREAEAVHRGEALVEL